MDQELLERMVKEVMASLAGNSTVNNEVAPKSTNKVNRQDYPLSIKRTDLVKSTTVELLAIADELENKYNAKVNAQLVKEAAELYEKRDRLRKD